MLQALFNYFSQLFTMDTTGTGFYFNNATVSIGDLTLKYPAYFALICSLISLIFIVVLCCLFVYKIIKLIGGLIR